MKRVLVLALFASAGVCSGCDRTHLGDRHGVELRAALARQVITPAAGGPSLTVPPREGLDPQEAAIVLDTYRRSLSPRGDAEAARRAPVMLLPQVTPGGAAAPAWP